jgi:lysozyme family protein
MTKSNFNAVMREIFRHEGGYVNHPNDPGGATNMGITHHTLALHRGVKTVSKTQVKALTQVEARQIYQNKYWDRVRGNQLTPGYDLVAMDGAVNSGPGRGARWLQRGVGAPVDGVIGPVTVKAVRAADVSGIKRACSARMSFLRNLGHWATFSRGWSRRVAEVEAVGTAMWLKSKKMPKREAGIVLAAEGKKAKGESTTKKTTATAAGGGGVAGGAIEYNSIPAEAFLIGVFVISLIVFVLVRKASHDTERERAYALKSKELLDV